LRKACGRPPPPLLLGECWDFRRLFKAVSALLELLGLSSTRERDALRCCTEQRSFAGWWRSRSFRSATFCGTMTVHDAPYYEMYQGTAAVRIYRRKQDTGRKGPLPRLGRASNAQWGSVLRLQRYAERHGPEVSAEYSKDEDPGAGCRHCPPFFFTESPGERRGTKIREPVSRQTVTTVLIRSLQLVGADTAHFSGSSMRRGCISAALTAKVQAPALYLQSGHGGKRAAQSYMIPADPSVWYENFAALQL
jgi:hypothetical protein